MKSYPSIDTYINFDLDYVVFDKPDGSNIRAECSPKKRFYKFGSRTQLLVESQESIYPSIEKIREIHEEELSKRFEKAKFERTVCFFEYVGPGSFAGSHKDALENMTALLFDIDVYKKGLWVQIDF